MSQTVPVVLRGEIYASAALLGAITYTLLRLVTTERVMILTGMSIVIIIRLAALYWRLSLPLVKQRHRDRL
ncbi:MAG: hypothetical protein R3E89_06510 [Thiolinea sp.]